MPAGEKSAVSRVFRLTGGLMLWKNLKKLNKFGQEKPNFINAKSATDLVREAKAEIENLTLEEVKNEIGEGARLIDIRETNELNENGKIPGATHAPRGMIEFYADENLPYHKPEFEKDKRIILHCASGGRSALAAKTLKEMGYANVAHLQGGFKAWKECGFPVED